MQEMTIIILIIRKELKFVDKYDPLKNCLYN